MSIVDAIELRDAGNQLDYVDEGSTCKLTLAITDEDGDAFDAGDAASITLVALYNEEDDTVINSRSALNVKNNSIGLVNGSGALELRFTTDDSVIVDDTLPEDSIEEHVVRLQWTWNDGVEVRTGSAEWKFGVRKLAVVT